MEQIKISMNQVLECATQLRNLNMQMYEVLTQAKMEMNNLNSSWLGESKDTILTRFNNFSQRFEMQKDVIIEYATFLEHTVNTYESLETTITANAQNINQ